MPRRRQNDFVVPERLKCPIRWPGPKLLVRGLLIDDDSYKKLADEHNRATDDALRKVFTEQASRLAELAISLGVDVSKKTWPLDLSFRLARKLCRGFDIELSEPRGRRAVWTAERYMELIADVESVEAEKKCSDSVACRALVTRAMKQKRGRYLPSPKSSPQKAAATLLNRLSEARNVKKNPWPRFLYHPDGPSPNYENCMLENIMKLWGSTDIVRP